MESASYISDEKLVLFWPSLVGVMAIARVHLLALWFRFLHKPDNGRAAVIAANG